MFISRQHKTTYARLLSISCIARALSSISCYTLLPLNAEGIYKSRSIGKALNSADASRRFVHVPQYVRLHMRFTSSIQFSMPQFAITLSQLSA